MADDTASVLAIDLGQIDNILEQVGETDGRDLQVHRYGEDMICKTDVRGQRSPGGKDTRELVLDSPLGFIPLWAMGTVLRWRFQEHSLRIFKQPEALKQLVRGLMTDALLKWGDAVPVRFSEQDQAWDFEVVVRAAPDCDIRGCTLAQAFFPDAGRHELIIFPTMFNQPREKQVDVLVHEFGHIFGLRHFFASSENRGFTIFGAHEPFTIMNYGAQSVLTERDKTDLKRLYQDVWSGRLTNINGTPIRQVRPFSAHAF